MSTTPAAKQRLNHIPGIAGWTFGHHGTVEIGGQLIPAVGLSAGQGPQYRDVEESDVFDFFLEERWRRVSWLR